MRAEKPTNSDMARTLRGPIVDGRPRVLWVRPGAGPATLDVGWADGTRTRADLTGVIALIGALAPLTDRELFCEARVINYGAAVGWPDGLDYSAESLRLVAEEQRAMTTEKFRTWQGTLGLSNQEAADVLGFSLRTVKNYRAGAAIPKAVSTFCRTTLRNPTVFRAHYRPRKAGRPRKSA
jgi:hypothetical protein